jgi:hypothetical protein
MGSSIVDPELFPMSGSGIEEIGATAGKLLI